MTDAQSRQTGVRLDGMVVNDMPDAVFSPEVAEEQHDDGAAAIVPNGAKSIFFLSPGPGIYKVELTATNTGSHTLDWSQTGASGEILTTGLESASVVSGEVKTYSLSFLPTATTSPGPRLQVALQGGSVQIAWPATSDGFVLRPRA